MMRKNLEGRNWASSKVSFRKKTQLFCDIEENVGGQKFEVEEGHPNFDVESSQLFCDDEGKNGEQKLEVEEGRMQMMDYSHFSDIVQEGKENVSSELEKYIDKK